MKTFSRPFLPLFALASLVVFCFGNGAVLAHPLPGDADIRFVLAPSGLNLRESADPQSKKLTTVKYGEKVKWMEAPKTSDLLIDNLHGGMAKVAYGDQIGYIFDGYLSRYPAPLKVATIEDELSEYARALRTIKDDVLLETCHRDWGGYFQYEMSLTFGLADFEEGFILAKRLFNLPAKLNLPDPSMKVESIAVNPDKTEHIWNDEVVVKRNEDGEIQRITYYSRGEGGGRTVIIEPAESDEVKMKISQIAIAD